MNPYIDRVFIFSVDNLKIKDSSNHKIIRVKGRETFGDYFKQINKHSAPEDINIICNSDIYFDKSIDRVKNINPNECFALSRWDDNKLYNRKDSQDAWIFKGKVKKIFGDFFLGLPGCDNRIAHEIDKVGYEMSNPSLSIRANHLHNSGVRNYTRSKKETVPGPYKFLEPCKIKGTTILHIALGDDQEALQAALGRLGEYFRINWQKYIKEGVEVLNYHISEAAKQLQPDIVFMQIQTENVISQKTLEELPGKVINWTGDVRQPIPGWYLQTGEKVHSTCFSNEHDVMKFEEYGLKSSFLNIGFDQNIFCPEGPVNKDAEIVFMGNHYKNRFPLTKLRYNLVHKLRKEFGDRFKVYGSGWDFPTGNVRDQQKEAAIYRGCKIAINCSHFDLERYTSDRLFRIMGSGAFCLSHNYKGIEKDFKIGEDLVVWDTVESLIENIKLALPAIEERRWIASNGCKKVHQFHTWDKRIEELKLIL